MRGHFLYNVTWRCQNECSYCWVRQTVRQRPELLHAKERPALDWINATRREVPRIIDIAGGEPFLYRGLAYLIDGVSPLPVGLSTNALATEQIERFCGERLPNVVSINASFHPETKVQHYVERFLQSVAALRRRGYRVYSNVVNYGDNVTEAEKVRPALEKLGVWLVVSPFEVMTNLGDKLVQGLCCQGGIEHLTIAPDGTAWPCLTTLRSPYWAETSLGNWLDRPVDLARRIQPCHLRCIDHYQLETEHTSGDMWGVSARPCEGAGE